jgi:hypothetical protein
MQHSFINRRRIRSRAGSVDQSDRGFAIDPTHPPTGSITKSPRRSSSQVSAIADHNYKLWAMDYGLWSMVYGLWSMDYRLWCMDR